MNSIFKPGDVKKIEDATKAIEFWEDKVFKLKKEYGEEVSHRFLLSILIGMVPEEMKNRALDKCRVNWTEVRDDLIAKKKFEDILHDMKEMSKTLKSKMNSCMICKRI